MGSTRRPASARASSRAPRGRRRLGRLPLVAAAAAAAVGSLYVAARETSMFALRTVEIAGAPEAVSQEVRAALRPLAGESLVVVGPGDVERRLEALPSVRAVEVDRDFPGTLRVTVTPERPAAVLRHGDEAWLVAASGRVVRALRPSSARRLPRVWVPATVPPPRPGVQLREEQGAAAVRVLGLVPRDFPVGVASARGSAGALTLVLAGSRAEVRLGDDTDLPAKLTVAARVLRALEPHEQLALAYLDVSLPTRVVASDKSQVEGRA